LQLNPPHLEAAPFDRSYTTTTAENSYYIEIYSKQTKQTITPIHNKNNLTPTTDSLKDNHIEISDKNTTNTKTNNQGANATIK